MRALVISGGGSKGAFAGGIAEYLIDDLGIDYDIFAGTSTGALLSPLLASGETARIRKMYTSVTQEQIFDVCPFRVRKTEDGFRTTINHLGVIGQFIRRRKTFGESNNLRKLIARTFSREIYERVKQEHKYVIVTVANLSRDTVEHRYLRDSTYEDFCDWIWISSNSVPFMTLVEKNGDEYADGGFGSLVPIQEAISIGATQVDVIVLNPRHRPRKDKPSGNAFNLMVRGFSFMVRKIGENDVQLGLAESRYDDIHINLIHTPRNLTENPFIFDPDTMNAWWSEGYEYARSSFARRFVNA